MSKRRQGKWKPPRTQWEKKFSRILDEHGIHYHANKEFWCYDRVYWPDFYIPSRGVIIEIDGRSIHARGKSKRRDEERTWRLMRYGGIKHVYRLWNSDVTRGLRSPVVRELVESLKP